MKLLKKLLLIIFILLSVCIFFISIGGYNLYCSAVTKTSIEDKVDEIRSKDNFVSYNDLPENLINATIAVEDHRYKEHGAIDLISIGRALTSNLKSKDTVEGGSTITQQVAKNLYFMTAKDDISRKVAELILSYHLETKYSKEEIFELYVNTIYYGNGYYGIKAATNGYLNKEPKDLNISEATMLAGVPNAPSVYAPTVNLKLCNKRQEKVIRSMVKYNYITQQEANSIKLYDNK